MCFLYTCSSLDLSELAKAAKKKLMGVSYFLLRIFSYFHECGRCFTLVASKQPVLARYSLLCQVIIDAVHPPLLQLSFPSLPRHIHRHHSFIHIFFFSSLLITCLYRIDIYSIYFCIFLDISVQLFDCPHPSHHPCFCHTQHLLLRFLHCPCHCTINH